MSDKHRPCLDALTEAMALPEPKRVLGAPRSDVADERLRRTMEAITEAQRTPRQQGRVQDYGRRAG